MGGKVVSFNFVLTSILIYLMSFYKLLVQITTRIDQLIRRFL
jgi:hypothetical protein